MEINKVKMLKLSILDNIEIKSAMFIDKNFPLHFHENWSLAHIEYGSENISFNNSEFLLNKNALVLIPPHSIHKNWGNKNNSWKYKATYINNDVIKSISKNINLDYSYLASFPYYITYCNSSFDINEKSILKILKSIFLDTINNEKGTISNMCNPEHFNDIINYLSHNYSESITLDKLEQIFKINKYKLQKEFKKKVGITPLEYQTSIKIENSKELFYTNVPLVEIALDSGFYDQSHFTHSFKKYVGVAPGVYKKNCNILQD